jgi:hypothetical protein
VAIDADAAELVAAGGAETAAHQRALFVQIARQGAVDTTTAVGADHRDHLDFSRIPALT